MEIKRVLSPEGKRLQKALNELNTPEVAKVGWFEKSKYENGTPVAAVAAIQEFGAPAKNIPPRPFMRPTVIRQEKIWAQVAEHGAKDIIAGKSTAAIALAQLGLKVAGDIREAITQVFQPPLKEATIRARLHKRKDKKTIGLLTKPLVDTGIMLGTLTNTVEKE